jgi:hypothetical protein
MNENKDYLNARHGSILPGDLCGKGVLNVCSMQKKTDSSVFMAL